MNAIELLGELLSKRSNKSVDTGMGRNVLERVLEKQRRERAAQQVRQRAPTAPRPHGGETLEHVLHDVYGRHKRRRPTPPQQTHGGHNHQQRGHQQGGHQHGGHQHEYAPHPHHGYNDTQLNDRATVLIRAMVNAAKADGQIDQCEQDNILKRLGRIDSDEARFLQCEFRRPINIHEFAHEVPRGMEDEVYAISLMAIDLDNQNEARYLQELAKCLRMDPCVCNNIHQHYGEPTIF